MALHNLKPADGATKKPKRIGRGQGSGHGGTSTRGNKGAGQRSGYKRKWGFEGGQMPLQRRLPKFGFKNPFREEYTIFNLNDVQRIADAHKLKSFDTVVLREHKLIKRDALVKILGDGEMTAKLSFNVHSVSAKAKSVIEANGGSVTLIVKTKKEEEAK